MVGRYVVVLLVCRCSRPGELLLPGTTFLPRRHRLLPGLARGLACTSAPLGAPSWGVWLRGVAMSYFCDIACCKIIVSRPIRNCKSNFVPTCSIFAPAHSTFISHVFYTENRRIPGAQNCNYIIRCCTQFFIAISTDLWYNTSATERRETHGEGWFW